MHVVSAMAEAMGDRGGSIVLIGSQSSVLPPVMEQLAYASSKGALHAAMFHLAKELGPRKIRVNTVVPTWMWGPPVQMYVQWQVADRGITEEEAIAEITAQHAAWERSRPTRTSPSRRSSSAPTAPA